MVQCNLMPIGRFARSCRLSVKALRHYDELGLLKPAFVDPQSKYRHYSRDQARDALMIGMLRSLDLPLAVIRRALAAEPADLKELIDAETARIEVEVVARQRTLLSLRRIAQVGELAPYEVAIREHPERQVARIRRRDVRELPTPQPERAPRSSLPGTRTTSSPSSSSFTSSTCSTATSWPSCWTRSRKSSAPPTRQWGS